MKKIIIITGLWMVLASLSGFETARAAEPNMADYTSYPVFMATTVEPNILIMLDNSGSMNDQAYSDEYGGSAVADCGTATARLLASGDDAEEGKEETSEAKPDGDEISQQQMCELVIYVWVRVSDLGGRGLRSTPANVTVFQHSTHCGNPSSRHTLKHMAGAGSG